MNNIWWKAAQKPGETCLGPLRSRSLWVTHCVVQIFLWRADELYRFMLIWTGPVLWHIQAENFQKHILSYEKLGEKKRHQADKNTNRVRKKCSKNLAIVLVLAEWWELFSWMNQLEAYTYIHTYIYIKVRKNIYIYVLVYGSILEYLIVSKSIC